MDKLLVSILIIVVAGSVGVLVVSGIPIITDYLFMKTEVVTVPVTLPVHELVICNGNGIVSVTKSQAPSISIKLVAKGFTASTSDFNVCYKEVNGTLFISVTPPSDTSNVYCADIYVNLPISIFTSANISVGNGDVKLTDVNTSLLYLTVGNGDVSLYNVGFIQGEVNVGNGVITMHNAVGKSLYGSVGNGMITVTVSKYYNLTYHLEVQNGVINVDTIPSIHVVTATGESQAPPVIYAGVSDGEVNVNGEEVLSLA
ncbi:DUF4097 family beta strand repeat-containing protein [Stygiolobus caldivivus]|uniref:DUF4097 domain-containing protein n=1 Tax=Stygiolobus caldivivus TaxID=2824673 RepID=A0A8D5ZD49_9CREN|nr:DUF4097 family beta strand repeat-containing protein [Stygiolobus caldivivus]BCU68908.1 hypothetical protein KN1_02050 [Stygiolobus caldivivus]